MTYKRRKLLKRRAARLRRLEYEAAMYEKQKLESIPVVGEERGPGIDGLPNTVLYSDRSPRDVVLSGPLGKKVSGPGRWFATAYDALSWARDKYGEDRVKLIYPTEGNESARWAVLVKNLRL